MLINRTAKNGKVGSPHGAMVKVLNVSKWVQTPVTVLCSLSESYSWERYEPSYPPSYR